ncbi:uncharacterized protein s-cup [Atheta coriaria]|uniref:uncharacterized protein s-cup n=1 Tax=Dalotia coriaria TaxID=877792 RepID=UPI0031F3D8CF
MSMKRLAALSSTTSNHGGLNYTEMSTAPGSPPPPIHGVNVMLGGAMLSGIILVVFLMCYCCHKNARKSETHMPEYWRDSGLPLHVYTVEGHQQCFDPEELVLCDMQVPVTPGPPPAYDAVVPIHKNIVSPARTSPHEQQFLQHQQLAAQQRRPPPSSDDSGLPSYEAALRLEVGHV